jgi:photosystem II stability/assembly factor-like uncharacterized protein
MSIEDRIRESMHRATQPASPSADAWASIERTMERRRRRSSAIRVVAGALVALAFVAAAIWAGLSLRGDHKLPTQPRPTLVVSGVKVIPAGPNRGPGVAKLYGTLSNEGPQPTGATVSCSLEDADGRTVATTTSNVQYIKSHETVTFGAGTAYQRKPVTAQCTAKPRVAVPPPHPQPEAPRFQLGGAAFFDAEHGIAVGAYGHPGCADGCGGRIEITADGGRTWTDTADTPGVVVSVTVFGSSDAWAVENETCAYICPALLHSTDGGRSWTNLGQVNIVNPSFASPTVGFGFEYRRPAMSAPLMKTTDGGRTWRETGSSCPSPTAWGTFASFVSPNHGWILCDGEPSAGSQSRTLFETTDGGATWSAVPGDLGSSGYPQAMFFRPDGNGWIGLGQAAISIMRTTDGGRHWDQPVTIDADGGTIDSLWFLDDSTGFAVISVAGSPADRLIKTTDSGTHWTTVHVWQASA